MKKEKKPMSHQKIVEILCERFKKAQIKEI
jgi:hypothetical protein